MGRLTLATIVIISLYTAQAEEGLRTEAFFKSIAGHWTGTGQLVDTDGEITDIQEDWIGNFSVDGSFEVRAKQSWGENQQKFYWHLTCNDPLDLNECDYWHNEVEEPVRFEVSLTDVSVGMRSPVGEPRSEVRISNTLIENRIEGEISLVRGNGIEVLSGKVEHSRADGGSE